MENKGTNQILICTLRKTGTGTFARKILRSFQDPVPVPPDSGTKPKKNVFRVTKGRGLTASRVRVPRGHLEAKYLGVLQLIAEEYGKGTVHITRSQGF